MAEVEGGTGTSDGPDGQGARPEAGTQHERPIATPKQAPQYGEYAPEGWSWSPESGTGGAGTGGAGTEGAGSTGSTDAAAKDRATANAEPPAASAPSPGIGPVPGVPHNLGVSGSPTAASAQALQRPAAHSAATTPGERPDAEPRHYRASAPPTLPAPAAAAPATATGASAPRRGDRIVTIALLVLGAFGALYSAASMQQLPASLSMIAGALGVEGFVVPASVPTLGTVGALLVLAVYALNLVYSIQRLRHRKLAFWVPLVAAAIAFIVSFAFTAFAISQAPELMQQLADPNATVKLLDYLGSAGAQ